MSEFTKGPWDVELTINKTNYDDQCWVLGGKGAICLIPIKHKNRKANANLIAAAPDLHDALLEAVEMIERQVDFNDDGDGLMINRCRAALAKVRGEK
jgi:hypothetical protein